MYLINGINYEIRYKYILNIIKDNIFHTFCDIRYYNVDMYLLQKRMFKGITLEIAKITIYTL